MTQQLQLPDADTAHATIVGIHKQAFLGRLAQHGIGPANEKEAMALLDLGVGLMEHAAGEGPLEKAAAADQDFDYGDGPFAQCLTAFDKIAGQQSAPGFEGLGKQANSPFAGVGAEPQLPAALVDSAYQAAHSLAQRPDIYGAAVVKRAMNEQAMFEYAKENGLVDETGNQLPQQ